MTEPLLSLEASRTHIEQLLADEDVDQIYEFAPKAIEAYPQEDLFYVALGAVAIAVEDFRTLVRTYDDAVEKVGTTTARVRRFNICGQLGTAPDTLLADFAILKAANLEDDDRRTFLGGVDHLAAFLQSKGRYNEALDIWNYSIATTDNDGSAYQQRGRCHFHLKDYASAIADATRHIELEPNNRIAWLSRAGAREAAGDDAGAREDRASADGLYDFEVTAEERTELDQILAKDRQENLVHRLAFFTDRDADSARGFGPVAAIIEHQWAFSHFLPDGASADSTGAPLLGLSYTMGLFYRFEHPELMVLSEADVTRIKPAIDELVEQIIVGKRVTVGDTITFGDRTVTWETPTEEDLVKYPYGYGGYFYRHFMNRSKVPMLLARL